MIARKFASNCNVCSFLRFCGTVRMIFRKQHCLCLSNGSAGRSHWPRRSRHLMKWIMHVFDSDTVHNQGVDWLIRWLSTGACESRGCILREAIPFSYVLWRHCFCLPARCANRSLFLCVKPVILNGIGLVSLAGRLPLLSYQEVCTDSWSPEVILLMLFRWYLVDL